ncbi:hypothetical protein WMF23_50885 [Sorangium sp. So ce542]
MRSRAADVWSSRRTSASLPSEVDSAPEVAASSNASSGGPAVMRYERELASSYGVSASAEPPEPSPISVR